jgi:hypothetical protein
MGLLQRFTEGTETRLRARDVSEAPRRELGRDAQRGRPDVSLEPWATARGLSYRGSAPQGGYLSVTLPWADELLFNVVRGRWPGGTEGVLCHESRPLEEEETGYFHGSRGIGHGSFKDLINPLGGAENYFKVPYTVAGVRLPHLATLSGLRIARRAERHGEGSSLSDLWHRRDLDDLQLNDPWVAIIRKNSDPDVVERVLQGPVRQLLSVQQGLGFEVAVEYGQVILARQDYLKTDAELDAFVRATEAFAGAVREICVPRVATAPLPGPLAEPAWLAGVRSKPKEAATMWPIGARLDTVAAIAAERGLAVEDARAFLTACPGVNISGQPFAVLYGRLPGTDLVGRILCCAERPMLLPDVLRRVLKDPGGPVGADVVVLDVDPRVPETRPAGEIDGNVRFAVAGGVLTAWRVRPRWQADGAVLDQLCADVAALMRRRGIIG